MRLLLIARHKLLANALCRGLREEGFHIEMVHDPREGWQRATRPDIDAVILDLLPREDDGVAKQFLQELIPQKPVLLLTVPGKRLFPSVTYPNVLYDTLKKPFSFDELLKRLRGLCRSGIGRNFFFAGIN